MSGSLYCYFAMQLAHVGGSELAFQISEQFAVLGAPFNLRTAVVVGGIDMMAQALELGNRPHVVVATPGRIVDLLKSTSGEWDLSRIKFLVCAHLVESDGCSSSTPSLGPRRSRQIAHPLFRTGTFISVRGPAQGSTDMPIHSDAHSCR